MAGGLGESARAFLARSITRGRVTDVTARLDMRPSDFAAAAFRAEAVDVRFNVSDAEMRFLTAMSPVTGARGSAILRGNSFNMTVPEARLHNLALTNGRVGMFTIQAERRLCDHLGARRWRCALCLG